MDWVDDVKETAKVNRNFYASDSPNIEDVLDLLRFEECDYDKGVKWLIDIEIKRATMDKEYKVDGLPKKEYFEFITKTEYAEDVARLSTL